MRPSKMITVSDWGEGNSIKLENSYSQPQSAVTSVRTEVFTVVSLALYH